MISAADSFLARKILFESGGPVLFIPPTFEERLSMNRVGICWDGSRLAARALHDAMPLLSKAEMVGIVNVQVDNAVSTEASPSRLWQYLTEMGFPCQEISLASHRSRIVPTILSLAADESMGLLVMGAYGHAPLIESVFGGVTFNMLRRMSIPILMSH
jgi:nucleotide-binding universal stress UspA family protein